VLPLLQQPGCRLAVEAVEQYADGGLDKPAYLREAHAYDRIRRARFPMAAPMPEDRAWNAIDCAVHRRWELEHDDYFAQQRCRLAAVAAGDAARSAAAGEARIQAAALRDILANPFRAAPAVDPSWLAWNGGAVAKLAAAIYDGRRFADLPILADALEDAGCADATILAHCRGRDEHVRGCWVVDLLTGRQ